MYNEALARHYNFNKEKINWNFEPAILKVTTGQMAYEKKHLLNKLYSRDRDRYDQLKDLDNVDQHPMFKIIKGDIEALLKKSNKL